MTPHEDSEHASLPCLEPLIIGRDRYKPGHHSLSITKTPILPPPPLTSRRSRSPTPPQTRLSGYQPIPEQTCIPSQTIINTTIPESSHNVIANVQVHMVDTHWLGFSLVHHMYQRCPSLLVYLIIIMCAISLGRTADWRWGESRHGERNSNGDTPRALTMLSLTDVFQAVFKEYSQSLFRNLWDCSGYRGKVANDLTSREDLRNTVLVNSYCVLSVLYIENHYGVICLVHRSLWSYLLEKKYGWSILGISTDFHSVEQCDESILWSEYFVCVLRDCVFWTFICFIHLCFDVREYLLVLFLIRRINLNCVWK